MEEHESYSGGTPTPNSGSANFVDIRSQRGRLLFRFDYKRQLIEWREGGQHELIDLSQYMGR